VSAIGLQANILLQFSPALGGGVPAYARIEVVDGLAFFFQVEETHNLLKHVSIQFK